METDDKVEVVSNPIYSSEGVASSLARTVILSESGGIGTGNRKLSLHMYAKINTEPIYTGYGMVSKAFCSRAAGLGTDCLAPLPMTSRSVTRPRLWHPLDCRLNLLHPDAYGRVDCEDPRKPRVDESNALLQATLRCGGTC